MKKLTLLIFILLGLSAIGQEVKNVTFEHEQLNNNIIINYDLVGKNVYNVTCYYTLDDGKSYNELISVTGDIGENINYGNNKQIIWDIFKDTDGIKGDIQFKIVAIPLNKSILPFVAGCYGIGLDEAEGFDDSYISFLYGFYGKKNVSFGLGLQYYSKHDYWDAKKIYYYNKNYALNIIINFRLYTKNNYQLLTSFQSGLAYHKNKLTNNSDDYSYSNVPEEQEYNKLRFFDNLHLDIIQNFNNFQIHTGIALIKNDYGDIKTGHLISGASFHTYAFVGIGYNLKN